MKNFRTLALLTSASLLLAACNGGQTPGDTRAATIELSTTAPVGGAKVDLKLNDTLTAVVKAADGTVLTNKKVTWTFTDSEGSQVVSVNDNGAVVARHFGTTTVTASVDSVKQSVQVRTYGLEAFAGVRDDGSDTAMFFRYRTKTGKNPESERLSFTVAGPKGWHGDQPVSFEPYRSVYFPTGDGTGLHWFELGFTSYGEVPAVVGTYTVKFRVDGEEWAATASLASRTNSSKVPSNIVARYDGSAVTATWDPVVPSGSYQAEVLGFNSRPYLKAPAATIQTGTLTAGQTYYVGVHALSLDVTAPLTTVLSGDFDVRYNTGAFQP